jgi:TDG/mug DNA glycosylase family protein
MLPGPIENVWPKRGMGLHARSFPPVASETARVLILGSMPGVASLRACQYYAHPRNQFWPIVGALLGFDPAGAYQARLTAICSADLALWDVIESCTRASSLDSAIVAASVVPNDFPGFLATHPQIRRICFNGGTAERLYLRHVLPQLAAQPEIEHRRLPSTSPAHAAVPFAAKLSAWRAILA